MTGVQLGVAGQAVGMFAVTDVDDLLVLAVFFGQAPDRRAQGRVVAGQYLGFAAILAVSLVGALGATLLPESVRPYLGLLPLGLGIRAAWRAWREHRARQHPDQEAQPAGTGPSVGAVAAVTLANGGDNIGAYIPVFTAAGGGGLVVYVVVFLIMVGVWCATGRYFATHPAIARVLSRWDHILLPVVLIGIGLAILIKGGAFGG
jgi:cadmium resistance protein CadD (predicted permease)